MKKLLATLKKQINQLFADESSGHDIYHLKRVLNLALRLWQKEGGDRLVIAVSALLHDIHRLIQNRTGKYCSPKDSLPIIRKMLKKVRIPADKISKIFHCIEFHEEYSFSSGGRTAVDLETLIIQDADNLDAMGAVGIARCFTYGGTNQIPIWRPDMPLTSRKHFDESKDDISEIHHFYNKLLRLKDSMNTRTAKQMAKHRHQFMLAYLKEFFAEWQGKE